MKSQWKHIAGKLLLKKNSRHFLLNSTFHCGIFIAEIHCSDPSYAHLTCNTLHQMLSNRAHTSGWETWAVVGCLSSSSSSFMTTSQAGDLPWYFKKWKISSWIVLELSGYRHNIHNRNNTKNISLGLLNHHYIQHNINYVVLGKGKTSEQIRMNLSFNCMKHTSDSLQADLRL